MKALVTGGGGFVGNNLVRTLLRKGWEVSVIDSFITGHKVNLADIESNITLYKGSFNDKELLKRAITGTDVVFHVGALPSVPRSIDDPETSHTNNVDGTFSVLLAAKEAGVKKLVYSASSSAYGDAPERVKSEDLPARPISPYGLMKYIGELYCEDFNLVFGLPTVSLRYFNVFGPRQDPSSAYAAVVPKFITNALKGERLTINGDGSIERDYTYVYNVVEANIAAATSDKATGVYNIACGGSISLATLAEAVEKLVGKKLEVVHAPERPGDIKRSLASINKAANDFGYKPLIGFEEGLEKTFEWYKNNLDYFGEGEDG